MVAVESKYHTYCYFGLRDEFERVGLEKKITHQNFYADKAKLWRKFFKYIDENDVCQLSSHELKNVLILEYIPDEKQLR